MKAHYSEQYYRNNWDRFIKRVPGDDYMNLESELENEIKIFDEETKEMIKSIYANRIYENAISKLCERCAMIDDIEMGFASLGYTNKTQEVHEMHRIIQRFEFNCIQAKDFKKKYIA